MLSSDLHAFLKLPRLSPLQHLLIIAACIVIFRHFEKVLLFECLDFCWINNAVFATLSEKNGVNSVKFWQWDGDTIQEEGNLNVSESISKVLRGLSFKFTYIL